MKTWPLLLVLTYVFLAFVVLPLEGQNTPVTGQIANTPDTAALRDEVLLLAGKARSYQKKNNFRAAAQNYRKALNLAQRYDLQEFRAKLYRRLLSVYFAYGYPLDSLHMVADTAIQLAEAVENYDLLVNLYQMKGVAYSDQYAHEEALEMFYKSLGYMERVENKSAAVSIYNAIANVFSQRGELDKALAFYLDGFCIAEETGWVLGQSVILNNIADVYSDLKDYEEAEYYFKESIRLKEQIQNTTNLAVSLCQLSKVYLAQGDCELSDTYIGEGLEMAKTNNYANGILVCLDIKAIWADSFYMPQERITASDEGLAFAHREGNTQHILDFYQHLYDAYNDLEDYEKAYGYLLSYTQLKDSLTIAENKGRIQHMEANFRLLETEMQNALLKEEREKVESEMEKSQFIWFGTILILLMFIIGAIIHVRQNVKLNKGLDKLVKEKTQELQTTVRKLESANEELTHFAYITSHDLKEPLRNINGFATLLSRASGASLSKQQQLYLDKIQQSAHRMNRLIEDVMQFSLVNKKELKYEYIELKAIIDEVRENLREKLLEKKAIIYLKDNALINSSYTHLVLIFTNLCANAIHYNDSEQPEVAIGLSEKNGNTSIYVQDNGIGIAPEFQKQIFVMFKRLHPKSKYDGTGLGLPITRKLLNQLGGEIEVESQENKGSTFFVELPERAKVSRLDLLEINTEVE
jgi:signal transduction histidine kinase